MVFMFLSDVHMFMLQIMSMLFPSCSWWFMFSMVMAVHVVHGHGGSCF